MVFLPNIPQPTDDQSNSQGQLLANNQQLDTSFSVDHYAFSDLTANNGKHKAIHLVNQSDPTTAAGEIAIYDKLVSSIPELFMRRASNGSVIQMSVGNPVIATSGGAFGLSLSTFLPGGIILKAMRYTPATSPVVNIPFSSFGIGSFPTACLGLIITLNINLAGQTATADSVTNSTFNLYTTNPGVSHNIWAIGY